MLSFRPRPRTRRIIVHDSHTDPAAVASAVSHMRTKARVMGLLEIGYHYVIERDGSVFCPRPHPAMGSHTPGCNHDSIGVCLSGGHEGADDFTGDQMASLHNLIRWLQEEYLWGLSVVGHSEASRQRHHRATCPALDMEELRAAPGVQPLPDTRETYYPASTTEPATAEALSTQQQIVLDYLKSGRTLTNLVAIANLGVGSLSSRIAELRKRGFDIEDRMDKDIHGRDFKKYCLPREGDEKSVAA